MYSITHSDMAIFFLSVLLYFVRNDSYEDE